MEAAHARFTLIPARPYSLSLTAERFARFPDAVDLFDGEEYRRLVPLKRAVLLSVRQEGSPTRAVLRVTLEGQDADLSEARAAAENLLARSLGASTDIGAFERRFRKDDLLGPTIRRFRGLRVASAPSLWEALVLAVLAQQINLSFAASIRHDLVVAFGRRARIGGRRYFDFPTPKRIAQAGARGLKGFRLSKSKRDTILRLARGFASGRLDEAALSLLSDEEVIEEMTQIRGVGTWTAEVALLRGLGRPDAFPAGDLSIVKYLAVGLLGHEAPSTEKAMRALSESWRPFRSFALVYMYAQLASAAAIASRPGGRESASLGTDRNPRRQGGTGLPS
jgi:DNA-3-methyladenine glycosylase II